MSGRWAWGTGPLSNEYPGIGTIARHAGRGADGLAYVLGERTTGPRASAGTVHANVVGFLFIDHSVPAPKRPAGDPSGWQFSAQAYAGQGGWELLGTKGSGSLVAFCPTASYLLKVLGSQLPPLHDGALTLQFPVLPTSLPPGAEP